MIKSYKNNGVKMHGILFELATVNFILICVIVFGAFALLRVAKTYLES